MFEISEGCIDARMHGHFDNLNAIFGQNWEEWGEKMNRIGIAKLNTPVEILLSSQNYVRAGIYVVVTVLEGIVGQLSCNIFVYRK